MICAAVPDRPVMFFPHHAANPASFSRPGMAGFYTNQQGAAIPSCRCGDAINLEFGQ
jgi:hypothetical protein